MVSRPRGNDGGCVLLNKCVAVRQRVGERIQIAATADDTEKTSENPWRQRRQRIDGRYRILNRAGDVKVGGKDPPAFFVACQNVAKKWDFA